MAIRKLTDIEKQRVEGILIENRSVDTLVSPEELHQLVLNYNWDMGLPSMLWVICNPICDKGTALLVYWRGTSSLVYQYTSRIDVPDYLIDTYDLVTEIEAKYLAGFYTSQKFRFDPRNDDHMDNVAEIVAEEFKRPIPIEMMVATPGEEPERESLG